MLRGVSLSLEWDGGFSQDAGTQECTPNLLFCSDSVASLTFGLRFIHCFVSAQQESFGS